MAALRESWSVGRKAAAGVLDILLPPQCLACTAPVTEVGQLCASCWHGVDFIVPPQCASCGLPFDYDLGGETMCAACLAEAPAFAHARAVMRYGGVAAALVIGLKHRDRTHLAPTLGRWLARTGEETLAKADGVVPVPLHWMRLLARRYNQSALLARELGRTAGLPVYPDLVRRRRATPPQTGLNRAQRLRNVRGAFRVSPAKKRLVRGRRLVLVDDVMTTGATAGECARVLLKAGAAAVDVLTLARVAGAD